MKNRFEVKIFDRAGFMRKEFQDGYYCRIYDNMHKVYICEPVFDKIKIDASCAMLNKRQGRVAQGNAKEANKSIDGLNPSLVIIDELEND